MFVRSMSALLASAALSFCAPAAADDVEPAKAVANLDGTRYMTFLPTNEEGEPDPDGRKAMPGYVVLGQHGDRLYGSMVLPSMEGEGDAAADQIVFGLLPIPLVSGQVKGKKFSIYAMDLDTQEPEEKPIKCKVLRNGNVKVSAPGAEGGKVKFTLLRLDEDDEVSGLYLGVISAQGAVPSANDNIVVGLFADNTTLTIGSILFLPSLGGMISGGCVVADFDPATGAFSYQGDSSQGLPALSGTVANGILTFNATIYDTVANDTLPAGNGALPPQTSVTGTLYFFGDKKRKTPKLKAPNPGTVAPGGVSTVTVGHRFVLPGALVAVRPAAGARGSVKPSAADDVVVLAYCGSRKSIDIVLDVAAGASGSYVITVTNPNGKSSTAKKMLTVG